MKPKPKGSYAVMAQRKERKPPPDELDFFPTPPWATRAFLRHVFPRFSFADRVYSVWEPACGEGHMSEVLKEQFRHVYASDVHDYGLKDQGIGAFVADKGGLDLDIAKCPFEPEWIITNPPFKLAQAFAERALKEATVGVALLMRLAFLETLDRYDLFRRDPFAWVAPFAERVPMTKGRWDPEADTATSYAWFVWTRPARPGAAFSGKIIPPGCRNSLTHDDDVARFAVRAAA